MTFRREYLRGDQTVPVRVEPQGGDRYRVRVGTSVLELRALPLDDGGVRIEPVGQDGALSCTAFGAPAGKAYQVRIDGRTWTLHPPERVRGGAGTAADGNVRAPMTGTITSVLCRPGDRVEPDQTLVVLTAMKMEHKLVAGLAGVVERVDAAEGGTADLGDLLVVVAPGAGE
jgi:biotin carboxyl carrier protein